MYSKSNTMQRSLIKMVRIKKEEIKGITDDRKKSSCAAAGDNATITEDDSGCFNCDSGECQLDWHEDQLVRPPQVCSRGPPIHYNESN